MIGGGVGEWVGETLVESNVGGIDRSVRRTSGVIFRETGGRSVRHWWAQLKAEEDWSETDAHCKQPSVLDAVIDADARFRPPNAKAIPAAQPTSHRPR